MSEFGAERLENRLSYRGEFSPFLLALVFSKQVGVGANNWTRKGSDMLIK